MTGLLETIRAAKAPERTVELCLRGDLVGEYENLDRRLKEVSLEQDDSFGGTGETTRIIARMDELRAEMQAASVTFWMRALGSFPSAALIAAHPAGEDDQSKRLGYDPKTYYPALVRACCYAIERGEESVDPGEMSDEEWAALFAALSNQQFDTLFGAAWLLDHGDVEVPTSPLASLISQRRDESSKRHGAGESRRGGSQGGSRGGKRSTSTTKQAD